MVHVLTPPPTDPSREDIIWLAGPRLIGLLLNWALLGILSAQVYVYHVSFPKDRRISKIIVYVTYILDWVQTCLTTYDGFRWFVYGWGNVPDLYELYTTFLDVPILTSTISAIVQLYYGWRIWNISRSRTTFAFIVFLALIQLGAGVAAGYYTYLDASEENRSPDLVRAVATRLGGSALVDTVIAALMTYCLLNRRGNKATSSCNGIVTRLIRLTIETGTITALAAIVDLVFFIKEHNGLHEALALVLCKIYSNALLVLFNNRLLMVDEDSEEETQTSVNSLVFEAVTPPLWRSISESLTLQLDPTEFKFVEDKLGVAV
ncbi:hypothetical protein FB45DRAFT_928812 [Roridomyces roridus]|uniref:DUF6534 domain-containing protein n=1 Tax=Roridomyces roridus TaxID=1738132 RepID=A0AAD7BHG9_9AGAR|nr:hypothetical protein FB45DRAFT_928812 [Roridomyces roridus]